MTALSAAKMLTYAEQVVQVGGAHPAPTILLEHVDGKMDVVLLASDMPPYEALPAVLGQLRQLVEEGGPVRALGFAADTYVREAPPGWDGDMQSLLPAKDDPAVRDAIMVWCCTADGAPQIGQRIYEAKLQLDGSYDVAWEEPRFMSGASAMGGRLDEMLRVVLAYLTAERL